MFQFLGTWLDNICQHGLKSSICNMITTNTGATTIGELHLYEENRHQHRQLLDLLSDMLSAVLHNWIDLAWKFDAK